MSGEGPVQSWAHRFPMKINNDGLNASCEFQAPQKMRTNDRAYTISKTVRINVWVTGKDRSGDK